MSYLSGVSRILDNPRSLAVLDVSYYCGKAWIITRVKVPKEHRRKGIGTELMKEICADADAAKIPLVLEVASYGEMDNDTLRAWYKKFGFRDVGGIMGRKPK